MKRPVILFVSLSLLLFGAAKCDKPVEDGEETVEVSTETEPVEEEVVEEAVEDTIPDIIIEEGFMPPKDNAGYNMTSLNVNGDILEIGVMYSGGCEEHVFTLKSGINYAKSYPPQITITLIHENNGDVCREAVEEMLYFDITELRYGEKTGDQELIIRFSDNKQTVRYYY